MNTDGHALQYSPYVVASFIVSAACVFWWFLSAAGDAWMPFNIYKRQEIGTVASVLAVILAIGALLRPNERRPRAYAALAFSVLVFLAYLLIVPL